MNTAIVRAETAAVTRGIIPRTMDEAMRVAEIASKERLYGVKSPQEAFVRVATGLELGLSPFQALNAIYVVEGRPTLAASWMQAVCIGSPVCEYFEFVESTDRVATYVAKRKGRPEMKMGYTIEQAQRAGLAGRLTWKQHPEDMLRARAISKLARALFPDVLAGLYTPDEVHDIPAPKHVSETVLEVAKDATATREETLAHLETIQDVIAGTPTATELPDEPLHEEIAREIREASTVEAVQDLAVRISHNKEVLGAHLDELRTLYRARKAELAK